MKRISVMLIALVILLSAGCASTGGGGGGGAAGGDPVTVDLGTVKVGTWTRSSKKWTALEAGVKNTVPIGTQYDGAVFTFDVPGDVTGYQRITINAKCFDAGGNELAPKDGNAMVVVYYDINGDLEGPEMGAGKNTPLKEFNLGGFSGSVAKPNGTRIRLAQNPGGVLIQASAEGTKFIELVEVTFHNGRE